MAKNGQKFADMGENELNWVKLGKKWSKWVKWIKFCNSKLQINKS